MEGLLNQWVSENIMRIRGHSIIKGSGSEGGC